MVRSTVGAPTLRTCLSAETPSCLLRLCSKVFETYAEQRPARMSLVSCAVTAAFAGSMVLLKMVRPERGRRTPKLVRITLVDCNFSPWSLRTHCYSETVTRTRCREADKVSVSGAPRKRYPQEDEGSLVVSSPGIHFVWQGTVASNGGMGCSRQKISYQQVVQSSFS